MTTEWPRCPRHGTPTRLSCAHCGAPICPRCYVRTEAGFKCLEHGRGVVPRHRRRWNRTRLAVVGLGPALTVVMVLVGRLAGGDASPGPTGGGGGSLVRAIDLGAVPAAREDVTIALRSISCAGTVTCMAVGSPGGVVMTTADRGATWLRRDLPGDLELVGVSCTRALRCSAVGATGAVVTTEDGGVTWRVAFPAGPRDLRSIDCIGASCVAVGDAVLTTSDGGRSWHAGAVRAGETLRAVRCTSATRCVALGGTYESLLEVTVDGGRTWAPVQQPGPATMSALACPSAGACYATGARTVLVSSDAGSSWRRQSAPEQFAAVGSMACADDRRCVALAGGGRWVFETLDGGQEWLPLQPPEGRGGLLAVSCLHDTCVGVGALGMRTVLPLG